MVPITLTNMMQTGEDVWTGDYRGYTLVWQTGACDLWHGDDFLKTTYGVEAFAKAVAEVDAYMIGK